MDSWDAIAAAGLLLVVAGVACVYWPAALILTGGVLVGLYYLRERHAAQQDPPAAKPD
jgi:uncharacterized membrane protein HdeD (DUF308 family)